MWQIVQRTTKLQSIALIYKLSAFFMILAYHRVYIYTENTEMPSLIMIINKPSIIYNVHLYYKIEIYKIRVSALHSCSETVENRSFNHLFIFYSCYLGNLKTDIPIVTTVLATINTRKYCAQYTVQW